MKKTLLLPLMACIFIFAQCKKDKNSPELDNPYGLPNATQEGKNTLGFLLNGVAWTPRGFSGTSNLSVEVDFNFNGGGFGISSYRISQTGEQTFFGIGVKDSLNLISIPVSLPIGKNTLAISRFDKDSGCEINFFDTSAFRNGELTITKLDRTNRIISGKFNTVLFQDGCSDTSKITEGRFDMSY